MSCCSPSVPATSPTSEPAPTDAEAIRAWVRAEYGRIAANSGAGCCAPSTDPDQAADRARALGYSADQLSAVPDGANLGLGCGNPTALAGLVGGETVLDLGCGAGFDALLAAAAVGASGHVIGVDTTPEMLVRAKENAAAAGYADICDFREGLIEALPVDDDVVDVIISNCVINLSPDKPQAFREAFRVLKPGARLAVSDIVLSEALPDDVRTSAASWVACVSGAMLQADYVAAMEGAGFVDIQTERTSAAELLVGTVSDPTARAAIEAVGMDAIQAAANSVWSARITATKPRVAG